MNNVRILIADRDSEVRRMIKAQTAVEDFTCDEATDGITALKLFRRHEYDVVILDPLLSELNGWNVCRQRAITAASASSRTTSIRTDRQSIFLQSGVLKRFRESRHRWTGASASTRTAAAAYTRSPPSS